MSSDTTGPAKKGDLAFTRDNPYGTSIEPMYSGATSFMRRRYSRDLTGVDVAVIGVPFDLGTTNRPGARLGPRAIRAASTQLAWSRPWPWSFDPFDRLHVIDYGDCVFDPGHPDSILTDIEKSFLILTEENVIPLSLGGDHLITYPILKTLHKKFGPVSLIHFDAHSDSWADQSHRVDHGTMFYHAAIQGLVNPAKSIQLGIRTHNPDTHGFNVFDAQWLHEQGVQQAVEKIHGIVGENPCYLTFDVDFLDPAFAPGTGTPVCGGFSTMTAINLLYGLKELNIVGCDVVEVSPPYDHAEITALAGATIATNMLCLLASDRPDVNK